MSDTMRPSSTSREHSYPRPESEIPGPPDTVRPSVLELAMQAQEEAFVERAAVAAAGKLSTTLMQLLEGQRLILDRLDDAADLRQEVDRLRGELAEFKARCAERHCDAALDA